MSEAAWLALASAAVQISVTTAAVITLWLKLKYGRADTLEKIETVHQQINSNQEKMVDAHKVEVDDLRNEIKKLNNRLIGSGYLSGENKP